MFKINNLTVYIEDKKILDDLSLTLGDGEIHVIMGKNGIGKSSLCKVIMGYPGYKVNGNISYNGKDLLKLNTFEIAQSGVMLISQNPPAIEGVTNAEALRAALREKTKENIDIFKFNKEMENICDKLNLDKSFIHKEINVGASGGERKKIELLHMGILKPSFIILDEIDSGLDVDALKVVSNYITNYYNEYKPTILMITHHSNITDLIKPNYVHILDNGKIVKTGDYHLAKNIEKEGFNEANIISKEEENE